MTPSTIELKLLSNDQLGEKYQETIDNFFKNSSALKKETILIMRDILEAQGFPKHRISSQITHDLKDEISGQWVRKILGSDYTDPRWVRDQSSSGQEDRSMKTDWTALDDAQMTELNKEQLRAYGEYLESRFSVVKEEYEKRKMAPSLGTTEAVGQSLGNKSVTNTPLHDQQITKPKYKTDDTQKEWQDIIAYECRLMSETFAKMANDFVPGLKIESEQEARRWANGIKAIRSIFTPAADEKYRLSLLDWIKIIKIMKVHGSSAASKLYKKRVADIRDLDPESLPEGFDKTLLAMKIDKDTDQAVFISPTKEHLDSRVNIILESITQLINNIGGLQEFIEMLETEFKLRNFRAAVLSEKLSDSK